MLTWLWNLIIGNLCRHKWEDQERIDIRQGASICGLVVRQRCDKCKNWRRLYMGN